MDCSGWRSGGCRSLSQVVHLHAPSTHLRCAPDGQRPLAPPQLEHIRPCGCGCCSRLKRWPSGDAPILRLSFRRFSHYYFNPFLSSLSYVPRRRKRLMCAHRSYIVIHKYQTRDATHSRRSGQVNSVGFEQQVQEKPLGVRTITLYSQQRRKNTGLDAPTQSKPTSSAR